MEAQFIPGLVNNLIFTACISMGAQIVNWVINMVTDDATIADWWWGTGYGVIALFTYFNTYGQGVESRKLLVVALALLWGLRLSYHLVKRSRDEKEELRRYTAYRKLAKHPSQVKWILLRKIFALQGLMMWITSLPLQVIQFYAGPPTLGWFAYIGALVWLIGFALEWYTDAELTRFKKDPAKQGQVLDTGFWRYTRHPNYVGEAVLWWGIFLIACENFGAGWWTIASAIRMHHRMAYRRGIAPLEQDIASRRPGYAAYVARTNRFYPWFPRKG